MNLNVLPLGSYDILIGMDWLEAHWSLVNYKENIVSYLKVASIRCEVQGIKRLVELRPITASQLGKCL